MIVISQTIKLNRLLLEKNISEQLKYSYVVDKIVKYSYVVDKIVLSTRFLIVVCQID